MNIRRQMAVRGPGISGGAAVQAYYLLDGKRPQRASGCCESWRAVFSPSGMGKRALDIARHVTFSPSRLPAYRDTALPTAIDGVGVT